MNPTEDLDKLGRIVWPRKNAASVPRREVGLEEKIMAVIAGC